MRQICTTPDCGKPSSARGLCQRCYYRARNAGAPLPPRVRMEIPGIQVNLKLSREAEQKLQKLAAQAGQTRGYLARTIIEKFLSETNS